MGTSVAPKWSNETSGVTELKISLRGDLLFSRVHRYERPRCDAQTPMILPPPQTENKLHFHFAQPLVYHEELA